MALVEIVVASAQGGIDPWVRWTGIATFLAVGVALLPIGLSYFARRRFRRSVAMSLAYELGAARFRADRAKILASEGAWGFMGSVYNSSVDHIDAIAIPLTERYLEKFDVFSDKTARDLLTMHAEITRARSAREAFPRRTGLSEQVPAKERSALCEHATLLAQVIGEAYDQVAKIARIPDGTTEYRHRLKMFQRTNRSDMNAPSD